MRVRCLLSYGVFCLLLVVSGGPVFAAAAAAPVEEEKDRDAALIVEGESVVPAATAQAQPSSPDVYAQTDGCPTRAANRDRSRPQVGLVLSGGGARGAAHIGVLRVIEELGIPVDIVVGTRMGGIVGALYASGWPVDEIDKVVNETDWDDVLSDGPDYVDYDMVRKREMRAFTLGGRLGIGMDGVKLPSGFREGQNIGLMLRDITRHVADVDCFVELALPFAAVATDAETGEAVVLEHGDLVKALRASMALPGYFSPVALGDRLLVDGGPANNMPVSVARAMGADLIIAVDIGTPLATRDNLRSMLSIGQQMSTMLARRGADEERRALQMEDVLIVPDLTEIKTLDFPEMPQAVAAGEVAAREELADYPLRGVMPAERLPSARFASRLAAVRGPATVGKVTLEGELTVPEDQVLGRLNLKAGESLNTMKLDKAITRAYGLDFFSTIDYERVHNEDGSDDLTLKLTNRTTGPTYLQFGLGLYDNFEGTNEFTLGASLTATELNRLTGQLRAQLQLGSTQLAHVEMYQPLIGSGHLFVAPWAYFQRHNLDIYVGGDPVARYRVGTNAGGFDFGWAHRTGEWRLGYGVGVQSLDMLIGIPSLPAFRSHLGAVHFRGEYDNMDRRDFPRSGARVKLYAATGNEALGADDTYNTSHINAEAVKTIGNQTWVLALRGAAQRVSDDMVLEPVSMGGPLNMSAFNYDELLGDQAAMVRLGSYRQFNRLSWLKAYVGASLEYGGAWFGRVGEVGNDDLWPVAAAYLGMATPLGPVMLIGGVSDHDRRALQFQLGYRF